MDGNSSALPCVENKYSEPRNSPILRDHFKIGPVNGIEVFKSAGTLVMGVQVPSRQPGNSESWVRISRGAQTQGGHSPFRYKVRQSQILPLSIGFSQPDWNIIPAKAKHKSGCEFANVSTHFTMILQHVGDN